MGGGLKWPKDVDHSPVLLTKLFFENNKCGRAAVQQWPNISLSKSSQMIICAEMLCTHWWVMRLQHLRYILRNSRLWNFHLTKARVTLHKCYKRQQRRQKSELNISVPFYLFLESRGGFYRDKLSAPLPLLTSVSQLVFLALFLTYMTIIIPVKWYLFKCALDLFI